MMLLLSAAPLAGPVLGVKSHFLDQPVVWRAGHNYNGFYLYCHDARSLLRCSPAGMANSRWRSALEAE
jgi:hypothetical protein